MLKKSMYAILSLLVALSLACGSDDDDNTPAGGDGGGEAGTAGAGGDAGAGGEGGDAGGEAGAAGEGGDAGGEAGAAGDGGDAGGEAGAAGEGGDAGGEAGAAGEGGEPACVPGDADTVENLYAFEARFDGEGSSVSYTGQSGRQALIGAIKSYIGTLKVTDGALGGEDAATAAAGVADTLNLLYACADADGNGGLCDDEATGVSTNPPAKQTTIGEISSTSLKGKMAGNDKTGQTVDWNTTGLAGWGTDAEVTTPEGLLNAWFGMISERAVNIADGTFEQTPGGEDITKAYVSAQGHDLQQLAQKFLLGAITFNQGADDYTDYDLTDFQGKDLIAEKKGLYGDNSALKEGKNYTALEHGWDEGFGYFGAARDYLAYTDDEIAKKGGRDNYQGYHDTNNDCFVDLAAEYNWGHSVNAAKRDRGHTTDLTADAFNAFRAGREVISNAAGALTDEEMTALKGHSDAAILAWEKAIAATVIHYINDTIGDMDADEFDFYTYAKHWSELKGFGLSFQFNRRSPMTPEQFAALHAAIGDAPALPGQAAYDDGSFKQGLLDVRAVVGQVYGFDTTDVETW